ncbi:MAG: class II D-tagatose-bisphosphate aldolase, non-catalytic subunit, partial [Erysipelotrichaceae bacterium]|nr:class II D-tagatose-bisphosphate aldolase, non-catalytic subunit [Erysipelotrichaceae bacterium]
GLFALAHIEEAWVDESKQSHLIELLEKVMLENPSNWSKHYHGNEHDLWIKLKYSFSDRSRYYMPDQRIEDSIRTLFENTNDVPYSLLSQYMPIQYRKVREGLLPYSPECWVKDVVCEVLSDYIYAVEKAN